MKKILVMFVMIVAVISSSFSTEKVVATGGKLKSSSICKDCKGVYYGSHGDGHWHRANKKSSSSVSKWGIIREK